MLDLRMIKRLFGLLPLLWLSACGDDVNGLVRQGYAEAQYVYLASPVPGKLEQLPVKRGDSVKEGQLVFGLDPEPEHAQLLSAQAEADSLQSQLADLQKGRREVVIDALQAALNRAQAQLVLAQRDFLRVQTLFRQSATDKAHYDQAKSAHEVASSLVYQQLAQLKEAKMASRSDLIAAARARLKAAQASVHSARWALSQKQVVAPVDGQIVETYFLPGELVGSAQPVLSIFDPKQLRIIFFINGKQLAMIKVGSQVKTTCDGCAGSISATVSYISTQAEYTPPVIFSREHNEKLLYRVKARLPEKDAEHYHPGQPVTVVLGQDR